MAERSYLAGFSFYKMKGKYEIRISDKPQSRIKEKCKAKIRSGDPTPEASKLKKLDEIIRVWVNYYSIAKA